MIALRRSASLAYMLLAACGGPYPFEQDGILELEGPLAVRAGTAAAVAVRAVGFEDSDLSFRFSTTAGSVEADGPRAMIRTPASAGNTVVQLVVSRDGVPIANDSIIIARYEQAVILKADDLGHDPSGSLSPEWRAFLNYAQAADLSVGLGLIGRFLESGSPEFLRDVQSFAADPRIEIWNHGYDHVLDGRHPDGSTFAEFQGTSLEHQVDHLRRTQRLAREKIGLTLRAFGAPGNRIDQHTAAALREIPEIAIWLFGLPHTGLLVLPRVLDVEDPIRRPSFERFVEAYSSDHPVLTLQLHPSAWTAGDLQEFRRVVEFLRQRHVAFLTPSEYALSL